MKKLYSTIFVLLTLLALTTGTVFAGSVVGMSVTNGGGGPTFTFTVTGEFSPSELKDGFVQMGDETFPLDCVQRDATTIVCHASKKADGNVLVGFGGARFWTEMPEPQGPATKENCYTLFDLVHGQQGWQPFGEYCMDREAVVGDTYVTYNPYVNQADWTYFYLLSAPDPGIYGNNPGNGFYPITAN